MPGEHLDLSSGDSEPAGTPGVGRRYVGVQFECCGIYSRIYINKSETAYEGHCPKCCRKISLRIGPDGTSSRFFRAT
jgi:hypothetical protein